MASTARITCERCVFRYSRLWAIVTSMLKTIIAGRGVAVAESAERTPPARWALASLSLSVLMSSLDTSIANAGLPTLAQAFNASFQSVQWVVLAYLLAITTLIVSAGRLGDLLGRRRLLLAGIALFTAASALCGLAPTLGVDPTKPPSRRPSVIARSCSAGWKRFGGVVIQSAHVAGNVAIEFEGGREGLDKSTDLMLRLVLVFTWPVNEYPGCCRGHVGLAELNLAAQLNVTGKFKRDTLRCGQLNKRCEFGRQWCDCPVTKGPGKRAKCSGWEGAVGDEEGAGFRGVDLGVGQSGGQCRLIGEVVLQAVEVERRIVECVVVGFVLGDFNLQRA